MRDDLGGVYNYSIVFFDGECNFCNKSVQFIIKHDHKGHFRFASLQSVVAESLLVKYNQTPLPDSIVLIEKKQLFTESTAVLHICKNLDGLWKGFYLFMIIPKPIRDICYRWFAKRRYRFFGKRNACMLPPPEIRKRFLS